MILKFQVVNLFNTWSWYWYYTKKNLNAWAHCKTKLLRQKTMSISLREDFKRRKLTAQFGTECNFTSTMNQRALDHHLLEHELTWWKFLKVDIVYDFNFLLIRLNWCTCRYRKICTPTKCVTLLCSQEVWNACASITTQNYLMFTPAVPRLYCIPTACDTTDWQVYRRVMFVCDYQNFMSLMSIVYIVHWVCSLQVYSQFVNIKQNQSGWSDKKVPSWLWITFQWYSI